MEFYVKNAIEYSLEAIWRLKMYASNMTIYQLIRNTVCIMHYVILNKIYARFSLLQDFRSVIMDSCEVTLHAI